ncbi:hypothetical protein MKS88_003972 [Plasmodium brasilianum]|uniref:Uncharacterized protein n=1 Tax=Plasmodium brasilianum TaxID=5824 RepID=A0ACB9Y701_PLABR|nr:hypothetical protein MKS88_003972 [Plasmodium brasilianum]
MERKYRLLIFIKITSFIILTWTYNFKRDLNTFNETFFAIYKLTGKLNIRTYRLLKNYTHDTNLNTVEIKEGISNSAVNISKDFSNNERECIRKKKPSNRDILNNDGNNKKSMKNNSPIYGTKTYSYFEKRIFNKLDNTEFLKKNKTFTDRTYKKIKFKKRRQRFSLGLFLSIVVLLVPLIDLSFYFICGKDLLSALDFLSVSVGHEGYFPKIEGGQLKNLFDLKHWMFREAIRVPTILKYCIPIFIIFVVIIICIVYYYKKVMKYEKIKFREKLKEY